ncbi:hypothetical protein Tco_1107071 [Tanacetum coccineum]
MWPVVEATTIIVPPLYKPQVGRPPKKRKKPHDEIANESCSLGKLSRKGKSVRCGKCGNVGHNRKGYRGQGGATQAGGSSARNVSGQGGARRTVSTKNVSGGVSNISSQSGGSSQPIAAQSTSTGARNASSRPSAAPSTASQGPTQHSAGLRQGLASVHDVWMTGRCPQIIRPLILRVRVIGSILGLGELGIGRGIEGVIRRGIGGRCYEGL